MSQMQQKTTIDHILSSFLITGLRFAEYTLELSAFRLKLRPKPSRAYKNPGLLQSLLARVHTPSLISAGVSRVSDPEESVSDITSGASKLFTTSSTVAAAPPCRPVNTL